MKRFDKKKRWMLYLLVFVLVFALNQFLRWISPDEEWKDGNLLVNLVLTACVTGGFIIIDRIWRKNFSCKKTGKKEENK